VEGIRFIRFVTLTIYRCCCCCRLITVNTIKVPEGVDWAKLVKNAMDKFNLEIAGGA
jgi:aspartate aminotransferase-like enzyme